MNTDFYKGSVVTTGTFDGVHLGHQAVLNHVKAISAQDSLRPLVVTFDRHPLMEIMPERAPKMLTSIEERNQLLRQAGVDVIEITFDSQMRKMTSREWLRLLRDKYDARHIVLGYDNCFGNDGHGMAREQYRQMAEEEGINLTNVECFRQVSSSAIRRALREGDIAKANEMLGRPWSISGIVEHGRGEGKRIGFPTANILVNRTLQLPANGVYAVSVSIPDFNNDKNNSQNKQENITLKGITNIGQRPSFDDGDQVTVETHIPGIEENLYGKNITITPERWIRAEKKFNSIIELKEQISRDVEEIISTAGN